MNCNILTETRSPLQGCRNECAACSCSISTIRSWCSFGLFCFVFFFILFFFSKVDFSFYFFSHSKLSFGVKRDVTREERACQSVSQMKKVYYTIEGSFSISFIELNYLSDTVLTKEVRRKISREPPTPPRRRRVLQIKFQFIIYTVLWWRRRRSSRGWATLVRICIIAVRLLPVQPENYHVLVTVRDR